MSWLTLSVPNCVEHGFEKAARFETGTRWGPGVRLPSRVYVGSGQVSRLVRISQPECRSARAAAWGALVWLFGVGCSSEELLTLGRLPTQDTGLVDAAPDAVIEVPFAFDAPELVEELYSGAKDDNPTLTWDMKEIYFSSKRGEETTDLWWAHRDNVDEPFSEPVFLESLSTPEFDTSPAVDGDGLTFWFSSTREDGKGALDILRVVRPSRDDDWSTATLVPELNSEVDDIPRPTGARGLIMPLGSRSGGGEYLTYFATRPDVEQPFADVTLVEGLAQSDELAADAFLSDDGLILIYTQAGADTPGDLYMAARATLSEPFGQVVPIRSLNTDADERDPWLSPDRKVLYFASDRDGEHAIYRANLQ